MSNVVHYDFRKALERYSAEIYSEEMNKYRLEALANNAEDACRKIMILVAELNIHRVKCVAIYQGCSADREIQEKALKIYFPQQEKEVCNE